MNEIIVDLMFSIVICEDDTNSVFSMSSSLNK